MTTENFAKDLLRVTVNGKRMVMLEEAEFERLLMEADLWEPKRPEVLPNGNYPAEVVRIDLAIDIIRHRRRLGLTPAELARRARVRLATLKRIEQGHPAGSVRTIEKIDRALRKSKKVQA
jgi:DNA-binding XRE family transcriptional regulator